MPGSQKHIENQRISPSQKSTTDLRKIADLSPNLLFVIDLQEQKIIYINGQVKPLLGFEPDYVYEKGPEIFKIVLHPEDYQKRLENLEKCKKLSDGDECIVEVRFSVGESNWKWFRITEKVFERDETGTVSHVVGTAQNIHEQRLSEENLKEEHRRFRNAQAIGHIGSYERKLPGDAVYCSAEFFRIHGLEPVPRQITVEDFVSYVHPDEQEMLRNAIHQTHSTGKPLNLVTRIVRPDGSIRYVYRRSAIITNKEGVHLKVYGTVQDITERVEAEEERKKFESLMRATELVAGTGSYEAELDSDKIYFSEGMYRLFGEEPESFTPSFEWLARRSHPDDTKKVQQILEKATRDKKPYTYTRRIYRKDGEMRILYARGTVATDKQGNPVKFIGLVQDITERQKWEEELRKSEERSRNLLKVLQNAPDAYLVLTPDFHIEMASDAYLEATLSQREQIIGKFIFDAFPDNPEVLEATGEKNLKASFERVLATKKPHRMSLQKYDVPRPEGGFEEKYWSPTNTPVVNAEGEVEYIIHRVIDVTEVLIKQADVKGLVNETEILKTSLEEISLQAEQLRESREMLQTIFDASPNSIILYRTIYTDAGAISDFEFVMVNAYNQILAGVTDDIIGKRFSDEFQVPGKNKVFNEFKRTAETGVPADFEFSYDSENSTRWLRFRATKLNDLLVVTGEDITKRKNSEQELLSLKDQLAERAKDRYRKIINSMDEGFCLLEVIFDDAGGCVDYRFLDMNPQFQEHSGLQDVTGKRINEILPDIEPYWKEYFGTVAKTGITRRMEENVDGIGRWIEGYAFRIGAPNDNEVAFIFKNITERKKGEERQAFFMKLTDALQPLTEPEDIQAVAMKMLGEHLQVNRAIYAEVLEDGNTLRTGPGYYNEVSPLPQQMKLSDFESSIGELFSQGETLVIDDTTENFGEAKEVKEVKEAFETIEVQAFIGVPGVRNGKLRALVGVHHAAPRQWKPDEIKLVEEMCERLWPAVERARIEKALRESEQRFRNLVEASALAVWETSAEGLVEADSPSWRAYTGQTLEEWIGTSWKNALHPDDREWAQKKWKNAVATGQSLEMEFRLKKAGEGYRWTNVKAIPIRNVQGRITKWTGMNFDIHDRKQAEEALLKAKEEAEAASRAKEDFVSTMSHEIRTPLNAVIGFTNLLLEQDPRQDQKENLSALSFSAENLLTLINEILDFSKLESGKVKLAENQFDLSKLLNNLMKVHHSRALANHTQIELELDERIPQYVATDQLKLSQVLHNLVSNAVKFTENGLVQISVELTDQEEDVLWLDFSIRDTGIGIPADKLDYVFEKFTQAEEATLRNYGGTGLGLSITKLLLDVMGSEIKVESKAGEGSDFHFSLPVKIAESKTTEPQTPHRHEDHREPGQMRLLLVEDVEINREILIQFLEKWWQVKPDEAVNGKEAVEMAEKNNYDLILMDIRMPVMNGYEATRQIRNLPGYSEIPILAVTADKNQQEQQDRDATQFDGLLTKPFKPEALKQKIIHHLTLSGKIRTTGEKETPGEDGGEQERSTQDNDGKVEHGQIEPAFDISRYTKMAGNHKEVLRKWIKSSILAFETYKEEFTAAADNRNLQDLSDLIHKNTSSIFYIQANRLATAIEDFRTLLRDPNITHNDLDQQKRVVLAEFEEVISGLKAVRENKS